MHPAAGVGGAVPALQRDRTNVVALFFVEHFDEGRGEACTDLGRGASQVKEAVTAVVEDRHSPPALRFGFGLVNHESTLHGLGCVKKAMSRSRERAGKSRPAAGGR